MSKLSSFDPYIFGAFYNWIVDSGCTPHLVAAVDVPGVEVPAGFARNGQIVLSISPRAAREFSIGEEAVTFEATFHGEGFSICVPYRAMRALIIVENSEVIRLDPYLGDGLHDPELDEPAADPETETPAAPSFALDSGEEPAAGAGSEGERGERPRFTVEP